MVSTTYVIKLCLLYSIIKDVSLMNRDKKAQLNLSKNVNKREPIWILGLTHTPNSRQTIIYCLPPLLIISVTKTISFKDDDLVLNFLEIADNFSTNLDPIVEKEIKKI